MGKTKKIRSMSHKKQVPPTGGLSQVELEADQDMDMATMQPDEAEMFRGLVNLQGSIREATCVTLATMFGDVSDEAQEKKLREKLQKMIDAGLLKKLIPRMVDPLKMVRLHALGALRNISVTGGIEICELMTSQNVITPLVKIITEHATAETFEKNDLHAMQVLEQSVALLSNLCESCQAAINELTQGNLLDPIMLIADKGKSQTSLHLETLKLLLLVTESNPRLNEVFGASAAYQTIIGEIIQSEQLLLLVKLHAVGIAMNVRAIMAAEANVARLLPVIEAALAYDAVNVTQLAQNVSENYALSQMNVLTDEDVDDDTITDEDRQKVTNAQIKYRNWRENVQTLSLALELVADLATGGDENDEEDEWASDDEDAMEQYAASQMEDTESSSFANSTPAVKALSVSRIFPLTIVILQGLVSIPQLQSRVIADDFERMRIRATNAVNNLLQTLSWEALGNKEDVVSQVFRNLCTLYANVKTETSDKPFEFDLSSSTNDIEAATTAAMWSALRRAAAAKQDLAITADEANLIMSSALQSRSMETRMNTIGMIGCVGQRSKNPTEIDVIARCLLSSLNDASLEVVAEALNAVFDVFGDEDFDAVFRDLQLLSALEQTAMSIKAKLRAERKEMDRDLVAHVKETHLNLVRFIKYKKKHL
ncbi:hypothetical protein FI667_g13462, partial [Globisporangium splendens]